MNTCFMAALGYSGKTVRSTRLCPRPTGSLVLVGCMSGVGRLLSYCATAHRITYPGPRLFAFGKGPFNLNDWFWPRRVKTS
jgi:hypothetical protein